MISDPLGIQEAHEIATSELAIDCQVEEGEVTSFSGKLELCPLGPDMFGLKGRALTGQFDLVRRCWRQCLQLVSDPPGHDRTAS